MENNFARNPNVDESFRSAEFWRLEADKLREILLGCGLTEELKWGKPCYTFGGKNISIIQRMKGFLALLFFKGALLKDPHHHLQLQGPNSRSGYRMCFTSVQDVIRMTDIVKSYSREAIEIEKKGLRLEKVREIEYPEELTDKFKKDPEFKFAFDELTPGRRRGYVLHFSGAKQSKTRVVRIEKYRSKILQGKGFNDR